jgi:DNA (cytosine-5)-methyltransferase 3A
MGWELFKNYLIAKEKFKPDFFLYENNKSAAKPIKDQISKELGVDLMHINSALVSAQNRQRFYAFNWEVERPEDRGIVLRDILETSTDEIGYELDGAIVLNVNPSGKGMNGAVIHTNGKSRCLTTNKGEGQKIIEPVGIGYRGRKEDGKWVKRFESNGEPKSNAITTATTDSMVGEPIEYTPRKGCSIKINENAIRCVQDKNGASAAESFVQFTDVKCNTLTTAHVPKCIEPLRVPEATKQGYVDIEPGDCVDLTFPSSKTRRGRSMKDKSNCLTTASSELYQYCGTVDKPIYEVKDGVITIKGKRYPIKLKDGHYIIRKLTPVECERLQTLPDGYTKAVSNAQRYKGLGNGWTAEVIIHILNGVLKDVPRDEEIVVLSMYDGIGTGRYCLDKMGFTNVRYYAYEIDKYAKQVSMSNYPDIIQLGDAFDLRHPDWTIGY